MDQTLETALILRDDYLELEAEEKNSGGFARVRVSVIPSTCGSSPENQLTNIDTGPPLPEGTCP